jgi:acetoacetyl-CoA reductase
LTLTELVLESISVSAAAPRKGGALGSAGFGRRDLPLGDPVSQALRGGKNMSRVALVTGGTRGIGAAISKALKAAGYRVAANYGGNDETARRFAAETAIPVFRWDVGNFTACQEGVARVYAGLGPIEILINNAGITRDAPFHKMTPEMWEAVIRTNLTSAFNMTRCVIDSMRQRGYGRIINVSSINGQRGQFGQVNYGSAKAGMFGFTKALSAETASKNITVNAVAPGYTDTEMFATVNEDLRKRIIAQIPVGRLGQAEDVARCVVFLAAEDAGFITGSTISVNGGQYVI